MNRRGFLTGILAASAAPAIVRAESLMRLWVPPQTVWVQPVASLQPAQYVWVSDLKTFVYDRALTSIEIAALFKHLDANRVARFP